MLSASPPAASAVRFGLRIRARRPPPRDLMTAGSLLSPKEIPMRRVLMVVLAVMAIALTGCHERF